MNLLPSTEKYNLKKGLRLRFFIIAGLLLTVSFFLAPVMLFPSFFLAREHLSLANLLVDQNDSEDEEFTKNILELPEEINSKLLIFQSRITDKGMAELLSVIISNLPLKVKLNSISFTKNQSDKGKKGVTFVITGIALDRDALVSYGAALRESKSFSSVDVPVSSLTKEKDLPFSMNIFSQM